MSLNIVAIALAVLVGLIGLLVAALNFYASAQAERHHLRSYIPNPHWQAEAGIDLISGIVLAVAGAILVAALLR